MLLAAAKEAGLNDAAEALRNPDAGREQASFRLTQAMRLRKLHLHSWFDLYFCSRKHMLVACAGTQLCLTAPTWQLKLIIRPMHRCRRSLNAAARSALEGGV